MYFRLEEKQNREGKIMFTTGDKLLNMIAMGSEFETVIIPIVKAHTIMLYRNLLYTAVTRAKKKVILVGHKPILFMAVHRADISKRNTMLGERIRLYCKAYNTERNALPELQQAG